MAKRPKSKAAKVIASTTVADYADVLTDVVRLLEQARRTSARAVNAVMTRTYWHIGRKIVEQEQQGRHRAGYGEHLVTLLAADLTERFGRGFSFKNLYRMRSLYLTWPDAFLCGNTQNNDILSTASTKSGGRELLLPWSHYAELLGVEKQAARKFYEVEALHGGWTIKQLQRQIGSQFYERTALSRNKVAMLTKHAAARPEDKVTPEEEIKDPFVLEFLGLKDEYSELELEEALIRHLESFLLELGNNFTFVGRQRRLRVGDSWFRVDLLLFHRRLRCLVIIDLKIRGFTPGDVGQMNMYCNYAAAHWTNPGERPPVGLILSAKLNDTIARYSLDNFSNRILAAKYRHALPDEKFLAEEIQKTHRILTRRPKLGPGK